VGWGVGLVKDLRFLISLVEDEVSFLWSQHCIEQNLYISPNRGVGSKDACKEPHHPQGVLTLGRARVFQCNRSEVENGASSIVAHGLAEAFTHLVDIVSVGILAKSSNRVPCQVLKGQLFKLTNMKRGSRIYWEWGRCRVQSG
jgi:hypothetical protein